MREHDPLAGYRADLASGAIESVLWPLVRGEPAPVELGQVFPLRTGGVEVVRVHEVRKANVPHWRAEFRRLHRERVWILTRKGGYTHDPRSAMRAGDDLELAETTLAVADREEGPTPPEPEAVPPHEVSDLPLTIEARERFAATRRHEADHRRVHQASSRLRTLHKRAERDGIDLANEIAAVELALDQAEARLRGAA